MAYRMDWSSWGNGVNSLLTKEGPSLNELRRRDPMRDYYRDGRFMCKEEYDERCRQEAEHNRNVQEAYRNNKTATEVAMKANPRTLRGISDFVSTNLSQTTTSSATGTALTMKMLNEAYNDMLNTTMLPRYMNITKRDVETGKDLLGMIKDISPEETPLAKRLITGHTGPVAHQWQTYNEVSMWPDEELTVFTDRKGIYSLGVEDNFSAKLKKEKDSRAHDLFWSAYTKTGKLPFEARFK